MRAGSGMAIDLGTVNTLVYVSGRGVVIDEPTAIAVSRDTGQVVSVGSEADGLTGKEPQGVDVVHPLRDGVIADLDATVVMLRAFLRRAQLRWRAGRVPAVVCLPVETTYVERRAVAAAAEATRPRCAVQLIDEPVAAAAGAERDNPCAASRITSRRTSTGIRQNRTLRTASLLEPPDIIDPDKRCDDYLRPPPL
jgi:rod shape-determining protein MreB and related proteins